MAIFLSQGTSIELGFSVLRYLDPQTTFDNQIAHICDDFFCPPLNFHDAKIVGNHLETNYKPSFWLIFHHLNSVSTYHSFMDGFELFDILGHPSSHISIIVFPGSTTQPITHFDMNEHVISLYGNNTSISFVITNTKKYITEILVATDGILTNSN